MFSPCNQPFCERRSEYLWLIDILWQRSTHIKCNGWLESSTSCQCDQGEFQENLPPFSHSTDIDPVQSLTHLSKIQRIPIIQKMRCSTTSYVQWHSRESDYLQPALELQAPSLTHKSRLLMYTTTRTVEDYGSGWLNFQTPNPCLNLCATETYSTSLGHGWGWSKCQIYNQLVPKPLEMVSKLQKILLKKSPSVVTHVPPSLIFGP